MGGLDNGRAGWWEGWIMGGLAGHFHHWLLPIAVLLANCNQSKTPGA